MLCATEWGFLAMWVVPPRCAGGAVVGEVAWNPTPQLPRSREVPGFRCHRLLREHRGPHAVLSTPRNNRGLLQPIISVRLLRFSVRLISNFSPAIDHVRQLFIWSSRTDFYPASNSIITIQMNILDMITIGLNIHLEC